MASVALSRASSDAVPFLIAVEMIPVPMGFVSQRPSPGCAVEFVVTQPIELNIEELVIRPQKSMF